MNLGQRQSIINRERLKRRPSSATKGGNGGRAAQYWSYCPICPPQPDPERSVHVVVGPGVPEVTGPCKHTWAVGGKSY